MSDFRALDEQCRICLRREGGVAAMPGLTRPRVIELGRCSANERARIEKALADLQEAAGCAPLGQTPGRGDQFFYRILLWRGIDPDAPDRDESQAQAELKVPEDQASTALVALWQNGPDRSDI